MEVMEGRCVCVEVEEDAALAAAFTWGLVLAGVVGRRTQREVRPLHATASLSAHRYATLTPASLQPAGQRSAAAARGTDSAARHPQHRAPFSANV